jgi:hypothetical protein
MKPWVLLLLAALAGCASAGWQKKDASAEQTRTDQKACEDAAFREANAKPLPYPTMGPMILQDSSGKRFNADRGAPFADPEGTRYTREMRLADECMRKRGYERAAGR